MERHPAERALAAAPAQCDLFGEALASGVLLADGAQGVRVQSQGVSGARAEIDQIEGRQEVFVAAPGQQAHFVTKVPDGVDGPGHAQQVFPVRGVFDPVAVSDHRHHDTLSRVACARIMNSRRAVIVMPDASARARKRR